MATLDLPPHEVEVIKEDLEGVFRNGTLVYSGYVQFYHCLREYIYSESEYDRLLWIVFGV